MKNIHVLPTDKPSRLVKIKDNLWYTTTENIPGGVYQHIYITNDEEILVRDYYISSHEASINQCFDFNKETLNKAYWAKKVILTTDQDLIKDGVQPIDDEFLEWFVKNPSCEEVEVNHFGMCCSNQLIAQCINCNQYNPVYKIIIPKEESKQETLEEAAEIDLTNLCYYDKRNPDCSVDDEDIEDHKKSLLKRNRTCSCDNCFYGRTKLTEQLIRQQKRMYSELELFINEVKDKIDSFEYSVNQQSYISEYMTEWFKQFKKK